MTEKNKGYKGNKNAQKGEVQLDAMISFRLPKELKLLVAKEAELKGKKTQQYLIDLIENDLGVSITK